MMEQNISPSDRMLDELLQEATPEDRANFLAMRTQGMRTELYQAWANSDRLRLDDVLDLPITRRTEMVAYLIGDPKRAIRACDKAFVIAPRKAGETVSVERGTNGTTRLYTVIDKPRTLSVRPAINALLQFGRSAETEGQRDKLREMSIEELGEYQVAQKAKSKKAK